MKAKAEMITLEEIQMLYAAIYPSEVQKLSTGTKKNNNHNSVGPLLRIWQYHFVILSALIVLRIRQGQNDITKFHRNNSG